MTGTARAASSVEARGAERLSSARGKHYDRGDRHADGGDRGGGRDPAPLRLAPTELFRPPDPRIGRAPPRRLR